MSTPSSFDLTKSSELYPNTFKSDKFSLVFSNLPSQKNFSDFRYLHNFVKSIIIPEYSMNLINTYFEGTIRRHPDAPKINIDLAQIQIIFRLSEDMKNYFLLLDYMRQIKYGSLESNPDDTLISDYTIKEISINLLDNHKRQIASIGFKNCFLTMISSLSLEYGSSEECLFTCNFSYSELVYKTQTING